jgi:hypothetical protein
MRFRHPLIAQFLMATLAGLVGGCATLDLPDKLDLGGSSEKAERPVRMTALWTDTVLVEAGVVGFGGRIMFYGRGDEDPIQVEGELTVFAYDDTENVGENAVPARKYVFRAEELAGHYSKSKLGHSYSFWIPWNRVGGPRRQVSLIARFKSAQGGVVMSEMTRHLLPGAAPEGLPVVQTQPSSQATPLPSVPQVTQAMHSFPVAQQQQQQGPAPVAVSSSGGMQTTTITMSEAMGAAARNQAQNEQVAVAARAHGMQQAAPSSTVAAPAGAVLQEPARASSMEASEIRALVREAVQESLAANQEGQSVDRFGRRKYRARIAPKLPPTRDPAPTPLRPATPQSVPPGTPQMVAPTGSATATSVALPPTQRPSSWVH